MLVLGVLLGKGTTKQKATTLFEVKDNNSDQSLSRDFVRRLWTLVCHVALEYIVTLIMGEDTRGFIKKSHCKQYFPVLIKNFHDQGLAKLEEIIF
jgi:hypothetical protein